MKYLQKRKIHSHFFDEKPHKREEFIPFDGYSNDNRLTEQILKPVKGFEAEIRR